MIQLHQMLHGYRQGHNYLQGSIVLPSSRDMDKIATLSDWSEYVGLDNRRDYITGYPLDESPYYVIAKTWYADGMRRPGCVWTHSLLINKDDLGKLGDFRCLLNVFESPVTDQEEYGEYRTRIALTGEESYTPESELTTTHERQVAETYAMFLSMSPVFYMTEFGTMQSQEMMLSILNYLPSSVIWQKSFCTGTSLPRSYEGQFLSMQLVTHEVNGVTYYAHAAMPDWSQMVAFSILTNSLQVGRLIRHFEEELGGSPAKLMGFLRVVLLINRQCKETEEKDKVLLEILQVLTTTFPGADEAQNIKESVLQPSLARDFGGEAHFLYIISTVDVSAFTHEQVGYEERLKALAVNDFLQLLRQLFAAEELNDWGVSTIKELERYISYADIDNLRKKGLRFVLAILGSSPELLNQVVWPDLWKEELELVLQLFSSGEVVKTFRNWKSMFQALLEAEVHISTELARMIFFHTEHCVDSYFDYLNKEGHRQQISVSRETEKYSERILDWLSHATSLTQQVVYVLVQSVDEESLQVREAGSKIWKVFDSAIGEDAPIQYFVYLYRLSFNWNDANALIYMQHAFYPIHKLLAENKMNYSLWCRVYPYTEHRFFIQDWDKCKKLRKAVIRRLKETGCDKSAVSNYTPNAETNERLKKEW